MNSIGNQIDDSSQHYEIILGDFNCVLDKKLDRCPPHRTEDNGLNEFKLLMHRHDLFDIWRKYNPKTKRFSFHRGNAKSRIDYIICSNSLSSKLLDSKINHFPFSDHDICTVKVKIEDIDRSPGIWVMNLNTISRKRLFRPLILGDLHGQIKLTSLKLFKNGGKLRKLK